MGRTGFIRYLWIGLGLVTLALGTVGVVLPVLPTVPFYLATVFCFAKGSPRLHRWFISTKLYQRHVKSFAEERSLPLRSKLTIMTTVTLMLALALWFMRGLVWAPYLIGVVWLGHVYCFLFIIKTRKKDEPLS